MKKIGIYAGTFDPIHEGHLAFAKVCINDLSLDKVVFLPEKEPRNKRQVTAISERTRSLRQAITHDNQLEVLELDISRFTVNHTLPVLNKIYTDTKLVLLMGSDVALQLHAWSGLDNLLDHASIAVGVRSQHTEDEIRDMLAMINIPTLRYTIHHTHAPHISSSQFK